MATPPFQSFDHSDFASWPEYRRLVAALEEFTNRFAAELPMTQLEAEAVPAVVMRWLPGMDCCHLCLDSEAYTPIEAWAIPAAQMQETEWKAHYICRRGHHWHTRWSSREAILTLLGDR